MIELKPLQGQVRYLVDDLRNQLAAAGAAALRAELRQEFDKAKAAERTASAFEVWLEDILDQAAVAWVLGCVFVRFCEDNALVERRWIGGEDENAPADDAVQNRLAFIVANPEKNDREWLREAFRYLRGLRATGKIFDGRNPVWRFDISGPAAESLSDFFRKGSGRGSLRSENLETRFLGDLYQDLSAHAKKTYALLQTPEFVEEFILDRTFEPAVREFGLSETSVIDPTCGSGHFLLGAFHRLVRMWQDREPAGDVRVLTERALGQVTGVDINPFAVAIARFRLLIAAMQVCKLDKLERTPAWPIRVATGDSLLRWDITTDQQGDILELLEGRGAFAYDSEDADLLKKYLRPNQYTVVVGNPPYITVADAARNRLYRKLYDACAGKYALTVPFVQRFFELARRGDGDGDGSGYVGQITGNAFMKREFGRKLIEQYFIGRIELSEVIDSSGAFIPGHGTPTIILIGRNRFASPRYGGLVRTVLGISGEPETPQIPSRGLVWSAIRNQVDLPGTESAWVSVDDIPQSRFGEFPWSLSGGGAAGLTKILSEAVHKLEVIIDGKIGFASFSGVDDIFYLPIGWHARHCTPSALVRGIVTGEDVRDWDCTPMLAALVPYTFRGNLLAFDAGSRWGRHLWIGKQILGALTDFSRRSRIESGLPWWSWYRWVQSRYETPLSITFSHVSTHNHFSLGRGEITFNQHAPVIKLPEGATEDEHLRLLGVLNSSIACFWLKQVSHDKGIRGEGGGLTSSDWERFFEFTGTKLQEFPLPKAYPLVRARELDELAQLLADTTPRAISGSGVPTRQRLLSARTEHDRLRARMIAVQEELDWETYLLYGLIDENLTHPDPPGIDLGERGFEILLTQNGAEDEWFERHKAIRRDKPNSDWPAEYQKLVERRIAVIAENRHVALIERPECKRRWSTEGWDKMQTAALRDWLLDRLESSELWGGAPTPLSVAQLADRVSGDADFRDVLELWVGHDSYDLTKTLGLLLADEHVPYLPAQRYKAAGLRKRALWERTWALQRREDAGEKVTIDVPPKYASADFLRASYWRARGKLDVPKERFISYPQAGRDTDGSELLGWAGWDQLAQARALATVYMDRKTQEIWASHRLLPLLAGLVELEPWLHQWFADERPGFVGSPAQFFTDFINNELSALSSDRSALALLRGVPEQR